jgi:DNA-directed RNA polymerase alpha subunit
MRKSKEQQQLWNVQLTMHNFNLASHKFVATWLSRHIQLHEMDFTVIDARIEDIGLSNRAYNVLKQNNVTSLQQLLILVSDGFSIPLLKGSGKIIADEIKRKALTFQNTHIFKDKNLHMRSQMK